MTKAKLKDTLRLMVHRYGFEWVERSLQEIRSSDHPLTSSKLSNVLPNGTAAKKQKKAKVTASGYWQHIPRPDGDHIP